MSASATATIEIEMMGNGTSRGEAALRKGPPLIVKHDADKRTMDVHSAIVVLNKTQLSEPIHEETDSRPGCADHFGEGFLTHFRDEGYRFRFLTEVGHEQEKPGKAFLAGVE